MMSGDVWIRIGGISGALAVGLGAFGAHALRSRVTSKMLDPRMLEIFETGVRYQMVHALALLAVGLLALHGRTGTALSVAGWGFLLGSLMFSGSLYGLALSIGPSKILGPITPLGGTAFIIGWIALAVAAGPAKPLG